MQSITHISYSKLKLSITSENQLMCHKKNSKKRREDNFEEGKINKVIETSPSIVEVILEEN